MRPLHVVKQHGDTYSVYAMDASINYERALLHNLTEWQAHAIAAILNG